MIPGLPYLHEIDLHGLELRNAKFHVLSDVPLPLSEALYWYNTTNGRIQVYNDTEVKTVAYLSDLTALVAGLGVTYTAGRNNNVTSSYLQHEGVFMNETPIVTSEDMILKRITASSNDTDTWDAEIHSSKVLIPGAKLSLSSEDKKVSGELGIDVPAGSCLSFFVNGNVVKRPKIVIELIKV
jgi:hypothetical protein